MKRLMMTWIGWFCCLSIMAQVPAGLDKLISDELNNLSADLTYMNPRVTDEKIEIKDINHSFGGEYFLYNNKDYDNFGQWLQEFYIRELGNLKDLNHDLVLDKNSIKKENDNPSDLRYRFTVTLIRTNSNTSDDFLFKDETITFLATVNKQEERIRINQIIGNWTVNPVYPHYEWMYSLNINDNQMHFDGYGGSESIRCESTAQKVKVYGDIKKVDVGPQVKVDLIGEIEKGTFVDLKFQEDGSGNVSVRRNYGKTPRYITFKIYQKPLDNTSGVGSGNGPQTQTVTVSQTAIKVSGMKKLVSFDDYNAPTMDAKFHYGLNNTFGLSANFLLADSRFTLGFYAAMCKNRISQLDLGSLFTSTHTMSFGGSTTNIGNTVIIDQNGGEVKVENCQIQKTVLAPDKRGYSNEVDPDGEAQHKKVYSYIMAMPGIHVNDWLHFDLGIGAARTQDTYEMADAYNIVVTETKYEINGVSNVQTEQEYKRSGKSFLYKDFESYHFAVRPGINFLLPVFSDEHFLKIGAGYTFVPGDKDANQLDFSIGYAFQF